MKFKNAVACVTGLQLLIAALSVSANQAPTTPGSFSAIADSANEIQLSWTRSTDDRRVRNYQLRRDGVLIATTGKTVFIDRNLQADTVYEYVLQANDGVLLSAAASVTVSTLASDSAVDETGGKPGNRGNKDKDKFPPDPEEPPVEEPTTGGVPSGWTLTFNDEFDGSGDLNVGTSDSNWRFETMDDGLHRSGNSGIDALGNATEYWDSVRGKRWSAWYNNYNNTNAYRENGALVMGGYLSGETDPTRPIDYIDNGVLTQYGTSKLYTAWIDTFARKYVGPGNVHVMDPESPGHLFKYGYIETRVNFSQMTTPGFRLSMWLMPASNDAAGQDLVVSDAYDNNGNNGVEIDLFEYEWIDAQHENRIHLAVWGGAAGNSSTGFDTTELDIQLHEGYHTLGFLWTADTMQWTINGHIVKEILDVDLIPDVYSYLIVSREMNSGVKNPDTDYFEAGDMPEEQPYRPRDPGIYAKNIWEFRDRINTDRALVDYIRVWQP